MKKFLSSYAQGKMSTSSTLKGDFVARTPQLTAHSSQLTAHSSQLTAKETHQVTTF